MVRGQGVKTYIAMETKMIMARMSFKTSDTDEHILKDDLKKGIFFHIERPLSG